MRSRLLALALGMVLAAAGWPVSAAGVDAPMEAGSREKRPFLGGFIRESRIVYPLAVGSWRARGEKRHDAQAAGVSVRFAREGVEHRWIDVFFYPVGVLSPEQLRAFPEGEVAALAEARRSAGVTADLGDLSRFRVKAGKALNPWRGMPPTSAIRSTANR